MAILKIILIVVFLISALAVTIIVLSQEGKSAGLGSLSGQVSGGNSYWDKNRKYSLEGKLEKWTKISATVFVLAALGLMLLQSKGNGTSTNTIIPAETPITVDTEAAETEGGAEADTSATDNATTDNVEQDADAAATSEDTEEAAN